MAVTNVLVIGATGMLGKPVTAELLNAGFRVFALVRSPEKAKRELPSDVNFIRGDLKKKEDVMLAMKGMDAVYLNLSIKREEKKNEFHSESDGLEYVIAAAKENGIKRILYLSSIIMRYNNMDGFKWWVFDIKNQAVEKIRSSGIPYTIFYPSNFMQSLSNLYKMGDKMMLAGKSKHKMYFIAAEDYGKQVAKSLSFSDSANREYVIQGPEGFTADEAVKVFIQHYKKEKLSHWSSPLLMLKIMGWFKQEYDYGYHIVKALNNYPEKFEAEKTWQELGKPEITVARFAESA
ncbi:MAG: SDR family oxidoreductase [Bacteroidota bacterium]